MPPVAERKGGGGTRVLKQRSSANCGQAINFYLFSPACFQSRERKGKGKRGSCQNFFYLVRQLPARKWPCGGRKNESISGLLSWGQLFVLARGRTLLLLMHDAKVPLLKNAPSAVNLS